MKNIFLTIILFFSLIGVTFAANTEYLKCPKIITENRSVGMFTPEPDLGDDWPYNIGNKLNTAFVQIKLGKSKATITPYHYDYLTTGKFIRTKSSLGKPIPAILFWNKGQSKSFKEKKDANGNYTVDQSYKMMGINTDLSNEITKMTWSFKNGEWFLKDLLYIKFDDVEVKIKSESKCINISKKEFKNYLKKGEGLDFYN
tara:strand:+ start:141 stop:740 length:600 start_codon:yes stop_codon:yes gene_type:complete